MIYSSPHASVRVYTRRHIRGCRLLNSSDNDCNCPKWIYSKARFRHEFQQRSAQTTNFLEACAIAQKILYSFDPEVRAAREKTQLQSAAPHPPKRGRKITPNAGRQYFKVGSLVEENLASGMELTAARRLVAKDAGVQYGSVVRYHREFREFRKKQPSHPG
jgi:hypothetical protein